MNLARMSSSVMSKISGLKTVPWSQTCSISNPYVNGEIFNMFNNVDSEAPTLSPGFNSLTSLMISMVPLEILVGMAKAWKKEVFSDPTRCFGRGRLHLLEQWHQHGQV